MRVLVDTHTLIWALEGDPRLSKRAKQILSSDSSELVFSLVSLWEIAIKIQMGRLKTLGSSVTYIRDEVEAYGMKFCRSTMRTSWRWSGCPCTILSRLTASFSRRLSPSRCLSSYATRSFRLIL